MPVGHVERVLDDLVAGRAGASHGLGEREGDRRSESRVVRLDAICDVLASAGTKLSSVAPPSATPLPVLPGCWDRRCRTFSGFPDRHPRRRAAGSNSSSRRVSSPRVSMTFTMGSPSSAQRIASIDPIGTGTTSAASVHAKLRIMLSGAR